MMNIILIAALRWALVLLKYKFLVNEIKMEKGTFYRKCKSNLK